MSKPEIFNCKESCGLMGPKAIILEHEKTCVAATAQDTIVEVIQPPVLKPVKKVKKLPCGSPANQQGVTAWEKSNGWS